MCYIGVRTCKGTVWDDGYMGSSIHMTEEDKANCNKIVLKRFDSREDAVAYEIEMHEKFDVANSPMFYNKAKQTSTGFDTTGRNMSKEEKLRRADIQKKRFKEQGHPLKGRKLSEEHKKKLSAAHKGRKHKGSTKDKMSEIASGVNNSAFRPWWYEVDGVRTEVYDETPKEFSKRIGVPFSCVKDRFRKQLEGMPRQKAPLKGYTFGRI